MYGEWQLIATANCGRRPGSTWQALLETGN
jgi:hypothetical protein